HRRAVDLVRSESSLRARTQKQGLREAGAPGPQHEPEQVVDDMYREWEQARVRAGLRALTALQREALELAFYDGYTHREVSAHLDIPLGTAKARLRDGLARLRDGWEVES